MTSVDPIEVQDTACQMGTNVVMNCGTWGYVNQCVDTATHRLMVVFPLLRQADIYHTYHYLLELNYDLPSQPIDWFRMETGDISVVSILFQCHCHSGPGEHRPAGMPTTPSLPRTGGRAA